VAWHPDFSDDEDVEGRPERLCDLERNGNASARQAEDDKVATAPVPQQPASQLFAGVTAVGEWLLSHRSD
jgi:hypothetical protein